jgi:hypothetical protein
MRRVVEVLFTDGCTHLGLAIERVRAAIRGRETDVEIRLVRIETFCEARDRRFLGSPTIRVDGRDVEHGATSQLFGMEGRRYLVEGVSDRAPALAWIKDALARS